MARSMTLRSEQQLAKRLESTGEFKPQTLVEIAKKVAESIHGVLKSKCGK
jgi:hypothetical protein